MRGAGSKWLDKETFRKSEFSIADQKWSKENEPQNGSKEHRKQRLQADQGAAQMQDSVGTVTKHLSCVRWAADTGPG